MRRAEINDLVGIGELLWKGREECFPYQAKQMNIEKGVDYVSDLILSSEALVLVEEDGDKIVAVFIAMLEQPWFADDKIAKMVLMYVDTDYRSHMYGIAMLKHYIAWAESNHAYLISASVSSGVRVEAVSKLYRRLGFEDVGVTMVKGN